MIRDSALKLESTVDTHTETPDTSSFEGESSVQHTTSPSRTIAKDDGFHVLQNSRRRAVLRYMLARPDRERFRMRTVAEAVAAWEHDTTVELLDSDERQRVYIALYQSHLPKLDDHDIIEYDQSRGVIEPLPLLDTFEDFVPAGLEEADETFTAPAATDELAEEERTGSVTDRILRVVSS